MAREASKIILYRGWMDGEPAPWERPREVEMSEEMREAMLEEMRGEEGEGLSGVVSESMGLDEDEDEIMDDLEEGEGESWEDQFDDDDDDDWKDEDHGGIDSIPISYDAVTEKR